MEAIHRLRLEKLIATCYKLKKMKEDSNSNEIKIEESGYTNKILKYKLILQQHYNKKIKAAEYVYRSVINTYENLMPPHFIIPGHRDNN